MATAVAELWLAWRYFGFLTGDDVEILAEAFRVATGFKYRAWDIRCLFVPDVIIAPLVWLGAKLGVRDVRTLVVLATIPSIIATAVSTLIVHALAAQWTSDRRVARAAALLFAWHWLTLGFASTVYPRTIATACVLTALWLIGWGNGPSAGFFAGVLCAIAFADSDRDRLESLRPSFSRAEDDAGSRGRAGAGADSGFCRNELESTFKLFDEGGGCLRTVRAPPSACFVSLQ